MEIDLDEPTRPQLAALLGVSSRWIGELRSKGDMPADGASWSENLEAWLLLKTHGPEDDGFSLDVERARLAKEQADSKAMDNAERRKELASLPDMLAVVSGIITLVKSRLMQVGAQVGKSDAPLRARVDLAISDALEELSMTRVEEAIGGGLDEEEEDPPEG
ncbi:hypothetical protein ACFB49_42630 [Sphingomonas sp. DBB INV C78]|uniref:terminase n=1 Tax=Sphingomonas sp. DBB INV C78 TaxID=3349434 RepID=UPI0036D2DF62